MSVFRYHQVWVLVRKKSSYKLIYGASNLVFEY